MESSYLLWPVGQRIDCLDPLEGHFSVLGKDLT